MKKHEIKRRLKQLDKIPLPDRNKIMSACLKQPEIDIPAYEQPAPRGFRLKPVLIACIVIAVLVSCFLVIAAEAEEYKEAVTFFRQYNLSTEGLSRGDIKSVYRDITTGKFSCGKTAEVIKKNIGGYEIFQDEPTPEDIENLWNYANGNYNGRYWIKNSEKDANGASYKFDSVYKHDESLGIDIHDKSVFEKRVDNKTVWSAEFSDFYIIGYVLSGDSVIVYGATPIWSSEQTSYLHIAMLGADGEQLWHKVQSNGFKHERIGAVLPGENEIAVFSRGDLNYLCLSKYDMKGNLKSFYKNEVGSNCILNAARLEDGYIVQLLGYLSGEYASVVKVNSDGSITDSFTYESNDESYFITDMHEYNGNIYLSAYAVPSLKGSGGGAGGRYDIVAVLNYIYDNERFDIESDELTKLVRDNYTAVLLVCDKESGEPQEYFSVKGSLGGKLALSDTDKLLWDVESITDTFFSPYSSSFTIGGSSYIYRYTFDENGALLSQEKTGEVVGFRR